MLSSRLGRMKFNRTAYAPKSQTGFAVDDQYLPLVSWLGEYSLILFGLTNPIKKSRSGDVESHQNITISRKLSFTFA
ncbi:MULTISPECIES: hypothetical protein [unclassified Pseudovibrio]|uniref:hypothetical protein n=1 Tax=unclassified Pseudovibrio TaxID=2627060 RepID=UPI000708A08A|nr:MULTISPECIES: hypothetical protein [unclassified Pseudovibrio]